ncbi:MAG: c-type cytochrome [Nitrospirae bacterium]|nr:c-type cytochrome [Nitrospirota bacterium]
MPYKAFLVSLILVSLTLSLEGRAGELDAVFGPTAPDELPSKKLTPTPEVIEAGKKIYEKRCLPCHGLNGAGEGPAADTMNPRPRDFTRGLFKLKSTQNGELPTDEDLFRTVSRGIPGSGMPSWKRLLSEEERLQVIAYIKTFSDRFKDGAAPKPIPVGKEPSRTPELIKMGKELFEGKAQCLLCHGKAAMGNGAIAEAIVDVWGSPLYPRNLTKSWLYKGGNEVKDIFLRISGGIEGTPMPAYLDKLTEEERWAIAHYVKSLQEPAPSGSRVVIESRPVSGEIPLDPNAPTWQEGEAVEVLMSGQVHVAPRNQDPTVDLVLVKSAYNEKEIGFWLEWDDRTKNVTHQDSERTQKMEAADFAATYPVLYPPSVRLRGLRDAVALQFPVKLPQGPEKPHFFLGDTGKPVNLWHWKADLQKVEEQNAKGYKTPPVLQPPDSQQATGQGVFEDGVWRVVLKRPLKTEDVANDIQFVPGQLIPVVVHVWDGANGETGLRRTISSWYFVTLKTNVAAWVYLFTVFAVALTAGFEVWLIRRVKAKPESQLEKIR